MIDHFFYEYLLFSEDEISSTVYLARECANSTPCNRDQFDYSVECCIGLRKTTTIRSFTNRVKYLFNYLFLVSNKKNNE